MEIHLKLIGILMITLALIHSMFPKYFDWKNEMQNVSLVNRQIMHIHTFFIALMLFLMGLLCVSSASALLNTNLGRRILFGMGVFCGARLFVQFFGYSSELWKGKRFESFVHVAFSILWLYFTTVFCMTGFFY